MTRTELLGIGFEKIPHFTIMNLLIYKLSRNRLLTIGDIGEPNEMMFIQQLSRENEKEVEDLVCIHNYDYDGYITIEKIKTLISVLT